MFIVNECDPVKSDPCEHAQHLFPQPHQGHAGQIEQQGTQTVEQQVTQTDC